MNDRELYLDTALRHFYVAPVSRMIGEEVEVGVFDFGSSYTLLYMCRKRVGPIVFGKLYRDRVATSSHTDLLKELEHLLKNMASCYLDELEKEAVSSVQEAYPFITELAS